MKLRVALHEQNLADSGGIHPPENKHQSLTMPIGELPIPEKLVVPLSQHIGVHLHHLASPWGTKFLKVRRLPPQQGHFCRGACTYLGTIFAIEKRPIAHSSGMSAPCIEITNDGRDRWIKHKGIEDFKHTSPATLLEMIADAGIAGRVALDSQPR